MSKKMNLRSKIVFQKIAHSEKCNANAWAILPSSEKETDNKEEDNVNGYDTGYLTERYHLDIKSPGNFSQHMETSHQDSFRLKKEHRNLRNNAPSGESM